jgi:tetratricopeptide (TPR) repeat protein
MSAGDPAGQLEWWREQLRAGSVDAAAADTGIGRSLFKLNRRREAIPYLQRAVERRPKPTDWKRLAACLEENGADEDRIWAWSGYLQLCPEDEKVRGCVLGLLITAGRLEEAAVHARILAEADPDSLPRRTTLARLLTEAGQTDQAKPGGRSRRARRSPWRRRTGWPSSPAGAGRRRAPGPGPASRWWATARRSASASACAPWPPTPR